MPLTDAARGARVQAMLAQRIPAEPIREAMHRGGRSPASLSMTLNRAYFYGQRLGYYTLGAADRLCTEMGLHPVEVYGDEWWGFGRPDGDS